MEQYIPKSALVAEIEKWISGWTERLSTNPSNSSFFEGGIELGKYILFFIDTIEVKEMQEEPVSEKKCMFTKDNYTDEDRMVLCEDCKEKCEYSKKEESVSEDEIEKQFKVGNVVVYVSRQPAYSGFYILGNANDLSIGYNNCNEPFQIALRNCTIASEAEHGKFFRELNLNGYKWNNDTLRIEKIEPVSEDTMTIRKEWFEHCKESWYNEGYIDGKYNRDRQFKEPVSENLEKAAVEAFKEIVDDERNSFLEIFKAGAKWQKQQDNNDANHALVEQIKTQQMWYEKGMADMKQQLIANAVEVTVHIDAGGYPYIPQLELYDYDKDIPLAKEGDKYKVILIKEN